jgi:hypothetical protein
MKLEHGIYCIEDLKKHYERMNPGRAHWFSPDTLRFFKSRISETLLYYNHSLVYFFTTERGPSGIRRASIRTYDPTTGSIDTIGLGFQGYKTIQAAQLAAHRLITSKHNEVTV